MAKNPKLPSGTTARAVEEWRGATPDSKPPAKVLLRIFERAGGVCHISGRKIAPGERWQAEHIIAQADKGENRESNLAPALIEPHKEKSKAEAAVRSKDRAVRKKHIGITQPKQKIKSAPFAKAEKEPKPTRPQPKERREAVNDHDAKLSKQLPARVGGVRFVRDGD